MLPLSNGGFPTRRVKRMHPMAHKSASGPYPWRFKTSGAIKLGVPHIVLSKNQNYWYCVDIIGNSNPLSYLLLPHDVLVASPKSAILTVLSSDRRMFPSFKSLCINPHPWMWFNPQMICHMMSLTSASRKNSFRRRYWAKL